MYGRTMKRSHDQEAERMRKFFSFSPGPVLLHRYYASDEGSGKGKSSKGTTAKVEECIPHSSASGGAPKKIPAANMKKCPPPPKIKIPSTAPVKTPKVYCPNPRPGDTCEQQPQYPECRLGLCLLSIFFLLLNF